jgi:hypothetical protein
LVVVVKAHLAEGGHGAHLYFKSSVALTPFQKTQ